MFIYIKYIVLYLVKVTGFLKGMMFMKVSKKIVIVTGILMSLTMSVFANQEGNIYEPKVEQVFDLGEGEIIEVYEEVPILDNIFIEGITESSSDDRKSMYEIKIEEIDTEDTVVPWEEAIKDYSIENNISYEEAEKELLPKGRVDGTSIHDVTKTYYIGGGNSIKVRVRYEKYSYGSFRQINRVISVKSWLGSGSHSWYELDIYDFNEGNYPRADLDIEVFGYSEIKVDSSVSGGFDLAGFNFSHSVGGTDYYRKDVQLLFRYKI